MMDQKMQDQIICIHLFIFLHCPGTVILWTVRHFQVLRIQRHDVDTCTHLLTYFYIIYIT